ncbi:MAG: CreA family protein [Bdellovibrionia bacterium]
MNYFILACLVSIFPLTLFNAAARTEQIGSVDTAFKFIGPDHKIVIEVFDDPRVQGISCYISRAKTGGFKGAVGVAEDKSEAAVACRQVGEISFSGTLPKQEEIFDERISLVFKKIRVVRVVDPARNTLVYLIYSDRLIEGSPKNNITAVAVPRSLPIPLK